MKKAFLDPEMNIHEYKIEDVIATSNGNVAIETPDDNEASKTSKIPGGLCRRVWDYEILNSRKGLETALFLSLEGYDNCI
jgi:hypothetical protein